MSGTTTVMKSCEKMEVNGTEDEEPSYTHTHTHSEKHYTNNISETTPVKHTEQSIEYTVYVYLQYILHSYHMLIVQHIHTEHNTNKRVLLTNTSSRRGVTTIPCRESRLFHIVLLFLCSFVCLFFYYLLHSLSSLFSLSLCIITLTRKLPNAELKMAAACKENKYTHFYIKYKIIIYIKNIN